MYVYLSSYSGFLAIVRDGKTTQMQQKAKEILWKGSETAQAFYSFGSSSNISNSSSNIKDRKKIAHLSTSQENTKPN